MGLAQRGSLTVKTRIFEETEQQLGDFPDGGRETS
jgi:hypothetical protein